MVRITRQPRNSPFRVQAVSGRPPERASGCGSVTSGSRWWLSVRANLCQRGRHFGNGPKECDRCVQSPAMSMWTVAATDSARSCWALVAKVIGSPVKLTTRSSVQMTICTESMNDRSRLVEWRGGALVVCSRSRSSRTANTVARGRVGLGGNAGATGADSPLGHDAGDDGPLGSRSFSRWRTSRRGPC